MTIFDRRMNPNTKLQPRINGFPTSRKRLSKMPWMTRRFQTTWMPNAADEEFFLDNQATAHYHDDNLSAAGYHFWQKNKE